MWAAMLSAVKELNNQYNIIESGIRAACDIGEEAKTVAAKITPEIYAQIADQLRDRITGDHLHIDPKDAIEVEGEAFTGYFSGTFFIYWKRCSYPEGEIEQIREIVPVWWEFETRANDGDCDLVSNDFTFAGVRANIEEKY